MATRFVVEHGSELDDGNVSKADEVGFEQYQQLRRRLSAAAVPLQSEAQSRDEFYALREAWHPGSLRLVRHFRYALDTYKT